MALNKPQAMKMIIVNTLMQYGQKLYDRGDFNEATAVFDHVLTYDSQQPQALQYLKKMGHGRLQDFENNEDLIKAIEAKKHSIEALKVQIANLRANLASQE